MNSGADPFVDGRLTRAVAHPTRSAMLEQLMGQKGSSPRELAEKLGIKVANACYHVEVLATCGAVEAVPGGERGEQLFRLPRPASADKKSWLDTSGSMREGVSEEQLKSLIETASDFPPGYARGSS